jgi:hypothetical protein
LEAGYPSSRIDWQRRWKVLDHRRTDLKRRARNARYTARIKRHACCVLVEVDEPMLTTLIRRVQTLSECEADDAKAIARAIAQAIRNIE